jgi:FMN-dependent NADH-azoreductase
MSTSLHVHVYFEGLAERSQALELRSRFVERFPAARLGRVHDAPVAFHPAPMYQVTLEAIDLGVLLVWLQRHGGELSLLVHPLLGDVVAEHTEHAIWLGRPLPLDQERLGRAASAQEPVRENPERGRTVLRIDASARRRGSRGRALADRLVRGLLAREPGATVVLRDLADGVPLLDEESLGAWSVEPTSRTEAQRDAVQASETLIAELEAADAVVLALPIYNFHFPAAFKAWIDHVVRARRTFRYTSNGPVGLLRDKPVYVIVTSGGTRLDGPLDFVTPWLRHIFGFIGLRDVQLIRADGLGSRAEDRLEQARHAIDRLTADPLRRSA